MKNRKIIYGFHFLLYNVIGEFMKTEEEKIIEIIDKLRPFLESDGGDIKFIKYEEDIVYISMMGACADCSLLDYTLKDGIEMAIKDEIPTVKAVININNNLPLD